MPARAAVDRLDAREQLLVQEHLRLERRRASALPLPAIFSSASLVLAPVSAVEDHLDARQQSVRCARARRSCCRRSAARGCWRSSRISARCFLDAGLERRLEVGVLDLVELRRVKGQGALRQQRIGALLGVDDAQAGGGERGRDGKATGDERYPSILGMNPRSRKKVPRHVEEHRRREAERVDPVEHAAVAGDERAVVLDAGVALDRPTSRGRRRTPSAPRRSAISAACAGANGVAHQMAVPTAVADRTPPMKPSHVLFGLTRGAMRVPADGLAPDVLQHVAQLHDEDEEEEQRRVGVRAARQAQHQQSPARSPRSRRTSSAPTASSRCARGSARCRPRARSGSRRRVSRRRGSAPRRDRTSRAR